MDSDQESTSAAQAPLWNGLRQPRRGPRHRLTVERVVDAGLAVVEEGGVRALSMRTVADQLGVGVASLYTYIPNKAALLALMSDTMVGQLPLPHTLPGTWRERTETWARDELTAFRTHPWLAGFDDTRAIGPHAFAWMDSAIQVFDGTGLSEREALTVVEAVSGYIRGHITPVLTEDQQRDWADPQGQHWNSTHEALRVHNPEPGRFPALESITAPATAEETFEAGLAWLLDGVAARIARSE